VDPPGGIPCLTVLPRVLQGPQRAPPGEGSRSASCLGVLVGVPDRPLRAGFGECSAFASPDRVPIERSGPTDQAPTGVPCDRAPVRGRRLSAAVRLRAERRASRPPRRV